LIRFAAHSVISASWFSYTLSIKAVAEQLQNAPAQRKAKYDNQLYQSAK
jgi:hypothetical protein